MTELEKPVSGQEIADLFAGVLIEVMSAVSPTTKGADEKLEDIASRFIDYGEALVSNPRMSALFKGLAASLVRTEHTG